MNNFSKKFIATALAVTTGVWMAGAVLAVPSAQAQTTAELQALIDALQQQIANLQAQLDGQGGGDSNFVHCNFTRNLTVGSQGEDVRCLQRYLNTSAEPQGFLQVVANSGPGSSGQETTYFGPLTRQAVIAWQNGNSTQVLTPVGLNAGTGFWGPSSRAHYNALAAAAQDDPPVTDPGDPSDPSDPDAPESGVDVSQDSLDNATVPKGANNVELLVLNFAAGEDAQIDGLTFERKGAGNRTDWNRLYVFQGDMRLGSGRTINSNQVAEFSNLNVDVNAGETVTLTIVGDLKTTAGNGNVHSLRLTSVDSDVDVDGYPLTGRQITVANVTAGSLDYDLNIPVDTNVQLGDNQVEVFNADLQASNEDMDLERVIIEQFGSVDVSGLDNWDVRIDGSAVDASVSVNGDAVTVVFDNGYLIEDGDTVTLALRADITADAYIKGGAGTIRLGVDDANDIFAVGRDFGFGVSVASASSELGNPGASFDITVEAAEITFTFNGPAVGDIGLEQDDAILFDFDVALQADYEFTNMSFNFDLSGSSSFELDDLRLVNMTTGRTLAGPDSVSVTGADFIHNFDDTFSLDQGDHRLVVRADIGSGTLAGETVTVSFIVDESDTGFGGSTANDLAGENLNTSENIDLESDVIPSDQVAGKKQTFTSADLAVSQSSTPTAQTYVVGRSGTVLGAFVLKANGVDSIDVRSLDVRARFSSSIDDNGDNDLLSPQGLVGSLALRRGSATGTILASKSVPASSTTTMTFDTSGKLKLAKNGSETIYLVGDLKSSYSTKGGDNDEFQARITSVTAKDSNNNNPTFNGATAFSTVNGNFFDIAGSGSFSRAEFDGSNPSENGVIVPGNNVLFSSYRLRPSNEDLQLRDFVADIEVAGNDKYFSLLRLFVNGSEVGSGESITGATEKFDNYNVNLTKDVDTQVQLRANLVSSGFGTTLTSGAELKLYLSTTQGDYDVVGLDSGNSVLMSTSSLDDAIRTFQIAASYPTFSHTGSNGTLNAGQQDLYAFSVSANANGDVELRQLSFDVTVNESSTSTGGDLQVSTFELLRGNTVVASTSTTIGNGATSASGEVKFNITNVSNYTVNAGGSANFKVRATVSNVGSDDANSVLVSMSNDDESASYLTDSSINTGSGNVTVGNSDTVWTDTFAEFNGFYLDHPTVSQTLSR